MAATSASPRATVATLAGWEPLVTIREKKRPCRFNGAISARSAFTPEWDSWLLTTHTALRRSESSVAGESSATRTTLEYQATVATGRAVERRGDQGQRSGIAADEVGPAALAEQQPRIGPELVDAPGSIESRGNPFHSRPFQLPRDTVPEDLVGAPRLLEVVHREARRGRHRGRS